MPLGPGKRRKPLDAAQLRLLGAALGGAGHPVLGDAATDPSKVSCSSMCQPRRDDVLGRAALQQEAAFVGVQAESHRVGCDVVEVHADCVAAEAPPVVELVGFDDDVAQVDLPNTEGVDEVDIRYQPFRNAV